MSRFIKQLFFLVSTISGIFFYSPGTCFSYEAAAPVSSQKSAWDYYESGQYEAAHRIWQQRAQQGDDIAQINLGALYDNGLGIPQNAETAAKWYRRAAISGNPFGQYNLGCMYVEGRGVARDLVQAEKWYAKAADQELPMAQFSLGLLFADKALRNKNKASVSQKNFETAVQWFYKSGISYLNNSELEKAQASLTAIEEISSSHILRQQLSREIEKHKTQADHTPAMAGSYSIGTAWPISQGYVITNCHVVAGSDEVTLIDASGTEFKAWVVARDEASDVAMLKVENTDKLPPALPLSNSRAELGTEVFTVGFPRIDVMGATPKCTTGMINRLAGIDNDPLIYQTTVPIQPGNSGGPLLNMKGEVVGIVRSQIGIRTENTNRLDVLENASCAIKIDSVKPLFSHMDQNTHHLQTLPSRQETIEKLFARIHDSVLIVVVR